MKKTGKMSFREAFRLHIRAFRDTDRCCPGLFLSTALHAVVSSVIPYLTIWLSAQILNELAGLRRAEVLLRWVLVTLAAEAALGLAAAALQRWKNARVQGSYYVRQKHLLTSKMFQMDFADVDKQQTRDLLSQIKQAAQGAGRGLPALRGLFENGVRACVGILSAIALTVSLFTIPMPETAGRLALLGNPAFLAVLLAVMAAVTAIGSLAATRADSCWSQNNEEHRLGNRIFSAFGFMFRDSENAPDHRIYNQQDLADFYMEKDKSFSPGGFFARMAKGRMGFLSALSGGISAVFTGVVYVFVCLKAWAGAFGVGSVTQYVGAVTALSRSFSLLLTTLGRVQNNAPFLQTTCEFLDIPNSMYQGSLTTEKRSDRQYEVEFRDVSFKYPGSGIWALRHVSMKFRVGERLAVVGENGSGKTTFIKLLCRLYDPQEGEILLNGIDIRKYNYRDYMNIFSVVFQDFQLLSQPLGANVAGAVEYDRERAEKALADAGFAERLGTLPDGLETMLYKEFGENGVEVSGGEAQKIAIARALYKDAPFLILDEPTAALDPMAEAEIYSRLGDIVSDRTAIYISHRLSSCKFCDEIAVFHEGQVIQQGSHEQLLQDTGGKYYALWNAQAQYYVKKQG